MKQFFKVTLLSALYTFLKMISGFIVGKIVALYTGPSGIAALGQLQSVVNILNGLATAPVGSGVVRYTAVNRDDGVECCAPWWRAAVYSSSFICFIILVGMIIFSKQISVKLFESEKYVWLMILVSIVLPLSIINTVMISILNGLQQYRKYILLGMLSVLISTLLIVGFVLKFSLLGALIATALNTSISGFLLMFFCKREPWFKWGYFFGRIRIEHFKGIFDFSLMAFVTAISMPVALLLVRNILIKNTGWQDAGQWQAVWKISEVYLGVMTMALSTYFLPRLASLKNSHDIRKEVNQLSGYIIIATTAMALMIYLMRDVIVEVLFTAEFSDARNLFLYQLIGDILKIAGFVYAYPMIAQGRIKTFIISETVFALSFVCGVGIFVKYYGVQGANLGYMFNYLIYFLFAFSFTNYFNFKIDEISGE